jgi:hypothetical protein
MIAILPTDGRDVIFKANITKMMYSFWTLHLAPLCVLPKYILFWMIQTGKYVVSPKWAAMTQGHGMSCAVTTALWVMYISPAEVTITDIEILFFAPE